MAMTNRNNRNSLIDELNRYSTQRKIIKNIEYYTGKKIKSIRKDDCRDGRNVLFEDGTEGFVPSHGNMINSDTIRHERVKHFCPSCGGEHHGGGLNWKKQCSVTVGKFWDKVRKLYWHRQGQSK